MAQKAKIGQKGQKGPKRPKVVDKRPLSVLCLVKYRQFAFFWHFNQSLIKRAFLALFGGGPKTAFFGLFSGFWAFFGPFSLGQGHKAKKGLFRRFMGLFLTSLFCAYQHVSCSEKIVIYNNCLMFFVILN